MLLPLLTRKALWSDAQPPRLGCGKSALAGHCVVRLPHGCGGARWSLKCGGLYLSPSSTSYLTSQTRALISIVRDYNSPWRRTLRVKYTFGKHLLLRRHGVEPGAASPPTEPEALGRRG